MNRRNYGDSLVNKRSVDFCFQESRDFSHERFKKNEKGVAVIYRNWGTTDSDNPEDWEEEPELWWIELS